MTKLQEARIRAGLSQAQLAEAAGIKKRSLQNYEQAGQHGRDFDRANLETILRACIALKCPLDDLIESDQTRELLREALKMQPKS